MSSPQAPVTDNMPYVVIPAEVPATGPQFQSLPDELLLEIFKHLLASNNVIDAQHYSCLKLVRLAKLRKVSKFFSSVTDEVFYKLNFFKFFPPGIGKDGVVHPDCRLPAVLPHPRVRQHLRRIQMAIVLTDHYWVDHPGGDKDKFGNPKQVQIPIATADQLIEHCPGARQLHTLTDDTEGFCNLRELELRVYVNEGCRHAESVLDVAAAAGFSVKAGKLRVSVLNLEAQPIKGHPELVKHISHQ
ncbi:hypothetical protein N0V83_010902 [Neocucurbitaria cava]|uniref:F-box domain-containing protein n=1 Tax=Neocucurbitaria cava TaxID=798079 RepID=A0A9W8XXY5_9PLEO|nr:hypothetical protein N0V83_010902 [Neocucurbitaria cava]